MNKIKKRLSIIFCISITNICFAKKGDDVALINISAEGATLVNQTDKEVTVKGNITVTKGSLMVQGNTIHATQSLDLHRVLNLTGSPVKFSQVADDGEKIEGQGNKFDYDTVTSLAVLSGRARVKKNNNIIVGDVIVYNTKNQSYNVTSGLANGVNKKSQGQVMVILGEDQNNEPI